MNSRKGPVERAEYARNASRPIVSFRFLRLLLSPYDGRAYFDALGCLWPKLSARTGHMYRVKPARDLDWMHENWQPVFSMRVHADTTERLLKGNVDGKFSKVDLTKAPPVYGHSPSLGSSFRGQSRALMIQWLSATVERRILPVRDYLP